MESPVPSNRTIAIVSIVVFAVAVALRIPACYESFWLDELHSAWTVWDTLGNVFSRADAGHQSPFYFVGLWFWKQAVGESELALRISSVLAVAASSAVLTVGVARWTRSVVAGATSGLVMALESNSLFFGTELRPYALVILFSSIALTCFLRLIAIDSRHDDRRAWIGMIVAILLASLCQPTAIGVLAWLPLVSCVVWLVRDRRQFLRFSLSDGFLVIAAAAVVFALWRVTLGETWQQRSNWVSFATATRIGQLWDTWDWTWLLVVPLIAVFVAWAAAIFRHRSLSIRDISVTTVLLALVALLATSLYWIVSRIEWIPVWHRRYFIAVLPLLACVVGGSIGVVGVGWRPYRNSGAAAAVLALVMILALSHQQGTLLRLRDYPVALVTRGEDWRDAVGWVRSHAKPNDLVFLDSGLIEANAWLRPNLAGVVKFPNERQLEYLVFAVSGPYDTERDVLPIDASQLRPPWSAVATIQSRSRRVFLITRRSAKQVGTTIPAGCRVFGFGGVSVLFQSTESDSN